MPRNMVFLLLAVIIITYNLMTNNRVFLPGLVGSTQSPGESLEGEDIKSKDSGVITFGENGKYIQDKYIQLFHESNKISISPRISHRPLQY